LLDTHALLWWLSDDPALSDTARKIIAETKNSILVSAASVWEIAIKVRLGKLPTATNLVSDFCGQVEREGFDLLVISADHAIRVASCQVLTRIHSTVCLSPRPKLKI